MVGVEFYPVVAIENILQEWLSRRNKAARCGKKNSVLAPVLMIRAVSIQPREDLRLPYNERLKTPIKRQPEDINIQHTQLFRLQLS